MFNVILAMRHTVPGLATDSKVHRYEIFYRSQPAITTVVFPSISLSRLGWVLPVYVPGIVTHLIVDATIEIYRPSLVKNIIVVWE